MYIFLEHEESLRVMKILEDISNLFGMQNKFFFFLVMASFMPYSRVWENGRVIRFNAEKPGLINILNIISKPENILQTAN